MPRGMFLVLLAAALGGGFWLGTLRYAAEPQGNGGRDALRRQSELHGEAVAALSRENLACLERTQTLAAQVADLTFLTAHATTMLRGTLKETPAYDLDSFLRRNPEARRYFPYLLDAVTRYEAIWPVDPMFALAILKQESNFGEQVVSRAGALGDAQFIATTAARYGLRAKEPRAWQQGRQSFRLAEDKRRAAREVRDLYLREVRADVASSAGRVDQRDKLTRNVARHVARLGQYYALLDEADRLEARGQEAYAAYKADIELALQSARALERDVRDRLAREEELIAISGVRSIKAADEKEIEVQLIVNDYLAQVDPRLSPILFTDALVHHLADLFREFNGDERLVASRYNASRRAMEQAVESVGGGVGIPMIAETQAYVNRVVTLRAFFAIDAGVLDNHLGVSCCTRIAKR